MMGRYQQNEKRFMDEYVKSAKEGLEISVSFFDNKSKQERELWVLRKLLNYLPCDLLGRP